MRCAGAEWRDFSPTDTHINTHTRKGGGRHSEKGKTGCVSLPGCVYLIIFSVSLIKRSPQAVGLSDHRVKCWPACHCLRSDGFQMLLLHTKHSNLRWTILACVLTCKAENLLAYVSNQTCYAQVMFSVALLCSEAALHCLCADVTCVGHVTTHSKPSTVPTRSHAGLFNVSQWQVFVCTSRLTSVHTNTCTCAHTRTHTYTQNKTFFSRCLFQ